MVCIESVNYTFFIVGKFSWDYTQLFLYGASLGLLFTHSFKLIIAKFGVFAWHARTLWLLAFFATLLISLLINTLFYLPPILSGQITIQSVFEPINFFSGIVNWARYVGVWVILYFLYQILERARKIEQEKLRSENAARIAELELLKTQLNPHFLFNALNSIKALVSIDQEKSRDAIVKLSELLRYTLNYGNQQLIPLHDELAEVLDRDITHGLRDLNITIADEADGGVVERDGSVIIPTPLTAIAFELAGGQETGGVVKAQLRSAAQCHRGQVGRPG